jgi:hypothetical protein
MSFEYGLIRQKAPKLLQLLELNHHNVQNAALSPRITELQCGRQNEAIFDLFSAFQDSCLAFKQRNLR